MSYCELARHYRLCLYTSVGAYRLLTESLEIMKYLPPCYKTVTLNQILDLRMCVRVWAKNLSHKLQNKLP